MAANDKVVQEGNGLDVTPAIQNDEDQLARGSELTGSPGDSEDKEIEFARPTNFFNEEPEVDESSRPKSRRESSIVTIKIPKSNSKESIYFKLLPLPSEEYKLLRYKDDYFFLTANFLQKVPKDCRNMVHDYQLVAAISYIDGDVFLIPVPTGSAGFPNPWTTSLTENLKQAEGKFIKLISVVTAGKRDWDPLPEDEIVILDKYRLPEDITYQVLIKKASKGRIIDSLDSPILRKARGLPDKT